MSLNEVEIYPREGTETHSTPPRFPRLIVEIYPREGTETYNPIHQARQITLKFIPVRGRKLEIEHAIVS